MKLLIAIAKSSGNKAEGINDKGKPVIVQERYTGLTDRWHHVWVLAMDGVTEAGIVPHRLKDLSVYEIDPDEDYWFPVEK